MGETASTLGDLREPADICRARGWAAGICLAGDEGHGVTIIRITAVGETRILARGVTHDGEPVDWSESLWRLGYRDWREVPAPLPSTVRRTEP